MAGRLDIRIDQGATFRMGLAWGDSDGNPVDLSSASAKAQLRQAAGVPTSDVVFEFSTANGRISLDSDGNIRLHATAAETAAIPAGQWVYDIKLTLEDGTAMRLVEGVAVVSAQVTV